MRNPIIAVPSPACITDALQDEQHWRYRCVEASAHICRRDLKQACQEDPQPDHFAAIDADDVERKQHRRKAEAQHGDRSRKPLAPAFPWPESIGQRRPEHGCRADTDSERELAQIFPDPDPTRPASLVVEPYGVLRDFRLNAFTRSKPNETRTIA